MVSKERFWTPVLIRSQGQAIDRAVGYRRLVSFVPSGIEAHRCAMETASDRSIPPSAACCVRYPGRYRNRGSSRRAGVKKRATKLGRPL